MYLIGMLVLLFLANLAMLMGMTNWPARTREGFVDAIVKGKGNVGVGLGAGGQASVGLSPYVTASVGGKGNVGVGVGAGGQASVGLEGFVDTLTNGFATAPIGSYDGVNLAAGLPAASQGFRANHPNVPLAGPPVEIGPDNLFYFKNNECKPECCGATLACSGGCVCTTPEQRDFINTRGGNRVHGGDF
jgi:hypothetical protein